MAAASTSGRNVVPTDASIVSELITYASPARPASAPLSSHTTLTIFPVGMPHVLASLGWSAIARSALPSLVRRSSSSSPAYTADRDGRPAPAVSP